MSSLKSSPYKERIRTLKEEINNATASPKVGSNCVSSLVLAACALPILSWLVIWFTSPRFVLVDKSRKRSKQKVFMWTLLFTVVGWTILYGLHLFKKNGGIPTVCSV